MEEDSKFGIIWGSCDLSNIQFIQNVAFKISELFQAIWVIMDDNYFWEWELLKMHDVNYYYSQCIVNLCIAIYVPWLVLLSYLWYTVQVPQQTACKQQFFQYLHQSGSIWNKFNQECLVILYSMLTWARAAWCSVCWHFPRRVPMEGEVSNFETCAQKGMVWREPSYEPYHTLQRTVFAETEHTHLCPVHPMYNSNSQIFTFKIHDWVAYLDTLSVQPNVPISQLVNEFQQTR